MVEDAELLRRYAEENAQDAFAELVRRYLGLVYFGALCRTADAQLAADISQIVFVSLAQNARALQTHPALNAWLFTTTRNAAINVRVAEERRRKREHEAIMTHESSADETPAVEWESLRPLLYDALDVLSDDDRRAVLLRFFGSRTFDEIGRTLRLPEETARKRVHRAINRLHAALSRRGVTSTAAAISGALTAEALAQPPLALFSTISSAVTLSAATGATASPLAYFLMSKIKIGIIGTIAAVGVVTILLQFRSARTHHEVQTAATIEQRQVGKAQGITLAVLSQRESQRIAGPDVIPLQVTVPATKNDSEKERFYEAADRAAHTSILENLFGALLDDLNLTADERARVLSLLVEARRSALDAVRLGRGAALSDQSAFAKLVRDAAISKDHDLSAVLGDQRFQQFADYRSTLEVRTTVRLLQDILAGSGAELSDAQGEQLMHIAQTQLRRMPYYPETAALLQTTGLYLDDRTVTALGSALSEAQVNALKQLQEEATARRKAQKEYAEWVRSKRKL